jgi:type IV secretory pathway TrbF-like protein
MNAFSRPSSRFGLTPEPETPYQRAGQAWDDRLGSARVQARNWRLMAFASLALTSCLAAALVWQGQRGSVTPWVVQVDRTGQAAAVGPAAAAAAATDPQIAWHLARWIEDVRALPGDPVVVRQDWLRAYDYTTARGALTLNDYARQIDPFSHVGKIQVAVDVSSVIRASPTSFRAAWTERRYQDGALLSTERWTAILTIVLQPPRSADSLQKNPLGIYVDGLNWSKELAG